MKDIKGYEGLYAITSCGKVWSYRSKKFLKPIEKNGYLSINLYKEGKVKQCNIHRLVAEAYIPNPDNKPQVNHKNEVKTDNYINNLEWATVKENLNYGTRNERANKTKSIPVYCAELDRVFDGASTAQREIGVWNANIIACCRGKRNTAGGYHWCYAQVARND